MRPSFVAVGDVMVDVVAGAAPAFPPVHDGVRLHVGGAAANAAIAAAAAGADAALVGRVGDDQAARMVDAELRRLGVRPILARDPSAATGIVVATPGGIVADRGANAHLAPEDIPDRIDAQTVFVSGWALLQAETARAGEAALDRAYGEWIAVDPASTRLLARFGRDRFFAATERASAVFPNEPEAEVLTGEADPDRAAETLARRYRLTCVKLGAAGAVAILDGRRARAAPQTHAEGDTFGAGDAFAGTLLAALAADADLPEALQRACAAGAAVARRDELSLRRRPGSA